jgi:hypothetical protein
MRLPRGPRRKGLSLLEVIISVAIFLLATVVISQMADSASRSADQARLMTRAAIMAESELAKVISVPELFVPVQLSPLADAGVPGWYYQIDIQPVEGTELQYGNQQIYGLNTVHVRVTYMPDGNHVEAEYILSRQVMDPRVTQPDPSLNQNQQNMQPM